MLFPAPSSVRRPTCILMCSIRPSLGWAPSDRDRGKKPQANRGIGICCANRFKCRNYLIKIALADKPLSTGLAQVNTVANGAKKRLLVVDDEKPIRQLLARIAQRAGFEVDT